MAPHKMPRKLRRGKYFAKGPIVLPPKKRKEVKRVAFPKASTGEVAELYLVDFILDTFGDQFTVDVRRSVEDAYRGTDFFVYVENKGSWYRIRLDVTVNALKKGCEEKPFFEAETKTGKVRAFVRWGNGHCRFDEPTMVFMLISEGLKDRTKRSDVLEAFLSEMEALAKEGKNLLQEAANCFLKRARFAVVAHRGLKLIDVLRRSKWQVPAFRKALSRKPKSRKYWW